ncbi:MORN repeat-containing protein [Anaerococcus urinomassiliensis]|uniref:hypothetical protein n=1 Tax=Anaerococcus urinomassiliensis TaxID=1745712 RepID=UPI0009395AAB|nr:hypothetical protein [Anaerococcus urinomassiliensis]
MENKKFLSYMALSLALIMLISVIYFFARPKAKNVEAYKIDKGTYYTGPMVDGKFDGEGVLKSERGTYQGSFKNGRFDGAGSFAGDDFTYKANFSKDKGNSNIEINLNSGETFIKDGDTFKNKDMKNED